MTTRMPLLLMVALAAGCVDVPPRTQFADSAADVGAADQGPDGMAADRGPDAASDPDAAPVDAAPDADHDAMMDAAGDLAVDAEVDGPPDRAVPDADVAPPDVSPPEIGPVDPLMFSDCLPLLQIEEGLPDGPVPCLQVAVSAESPARLSWREAVALDASRVAFVGGLGVDADRMTVASPRVDIYDADLDRWSARTSLTTGRWSHVATRWTGGGADQLVVMGGAQRPEGSLWTGLSDGNTLSVGADAWETRQVVLPGRLADGATWSNADGVWFIGGHADARLAGSSAVVSWRPGQEPISQPSLSLGRYGHTVAGLRDRPLVIGGAGVDGVGQGSAEFLGANGWDRTDDDRLRRVHAEALELGARVLVAGGRPVAYDFAPDPLGPGPDRLQDTVYVTLPPAGAVALDPGPDMHRPRFAFTLSRLGPDPGWGLAVGGETTASGPPIVEVYEDRQPLGVWWPFTLPPPTDRARSFHSAASLADGRVIVSGGVQGGARPDEVFMNQTLVFRLAERDPGQMAPPDGIE